MNLPRVNLMRNKLEQCHFSHSADSELLYLSRVVERAKLPQIVQ